MVAARRHDLMNTQFLERFPVSNCHMSVNKRRLYAIMQSLFLLLRKFRTQKRHHCLVASQYAVLGLYAMQIPVARIRNTHTWRCSCRVILFGIQRGAAEPDAHRVLSLVQLAVIGFRSDDIFHRGSRHTSGNQSAYQEPRYGRIAIREMKYVWFFFFQFAQTKSAKSGVRERAVVIGIAVAAIGGNRFNSNCEQIVRIFLKKRQRFPQGRTMLGQEFRVAHGLQQSNLLRLAFPREIIFLISVKPGDVLLYLWRERRLGQKFGPRSCTHSRHQFVRPKCFPVEIARGAQVRIKLLVVIPIKLLYVDSQTLQHVFRNLAVLARTLDGFRAAVRQQQPSADCKFVASRVPTKVVVTVENQNSRALSLLLAIEMRRG